VAIAHDGAPPSLVLDAGTGIRRVTHLLGGAPFRGTILLGHLHWDHTQGLPFFHGADRDGADTTVLLPESGQEATSLFQRMMSPPFFPIGPDGLRGTWRFEGLEAGEHEIERFRVLALDIPHKGGRTFGFRVGDGAGSIAYLSDHGPAATGQGPEGWGPYHEAALRLADGVDLLLHDAQHTADELPSRVAFGHSAADYAVELGRRAGVGRVLLFHHDPSRTDEALDDIVASFASAGVPVEAAREGTLVEVAGRAVDSLRP
jgi:ribonuclease BN (tRNA processing enzyme)